MSQLPAVRKLNQLLFDQNKLIERRNKLLAAPVVRIGQYNRVLDQIKAVNSQVLKQADLVKTVAATQFGAGMRQMALSATVAGAAISGVMLRTQAHFSPGAVLRYQYRLGDLSATVGEILSPAFERFSTLVYRTGRVLNALPKDTKNTIATFATIGSVATLAGGAMWAMARAGRAVSAIGAGFSASLAANAAKGGSMLPALLQTIGASGAFAAGQNTFALGGAGLSYMTRGNAAKAIGLGALSSSLGSKLSTWIGERVAVKLAAAGMARGAKGSRFLGKAAPYAAAALLIDDAFDFFTGKSAQGYLTGTNSGKPMWERGTDTTGKDAQREIMSFDSVMGAGRRLRSQALLHSGTGPLVNDVVRGQMQFAPNLAEMKKNNPGQDAQVVIDALLDAVNRLADQLVAGPGSWINPKGSAP